MREICKDASNFSFYFFKAMNRIFRKTIEEAITKILMRINKSIIQNESSSLGEKKTKTMEFMEMKEIGFNN